MVQVRTNKQANREIDTHIYTHTHIHACMHTYTHPCHNKPSYHSIPSARPYHVHKNSGLYTCIPTCMRTYIHACMNACMQSDIHICTWPCACMCFCYMLSIDVVYFGCAHFPIFCTCCMSCYTVLVHGAQRYMLDYTVLL